MWNLGDDGFKDQMGGPVAPRHRHVDVRPPGVQSGWTMGWEGQGRLPRGRQQPRHHHDGGPSGAR